MNDRKHGIDWWVEHVSWRLIGGDLKHRKEDCINKYGEDDVALESWSIIEKRVHGWTRVDDKKTEYILFFWADTGRWMLATFPSL